jgi:hypothetical protein
LINKTLGLPFDDPVETYSTTPHLYTDLGIPEGTKGMLPKDQRTRAGLDAEAVEDLGETGKARKPAGRREGRSRGGRGGSAGQRDRRDSGGDRAPREGSDDQPATSGDSAPKRRKRNRRRTRGGSASGTSPSTES